MLVTLIMKTRDRDNAVTPIPVLIPAVPRDKRDGRLIQADDYDIAVQIVRLTNPVALLAENSGVGDATEYPMVGIRHRAGLFALLRLTQAVQTRDLADLKAYVRLQSADEFKRWRDSDAELRVAFGTKEWPRPKRKELEAAQEGIVKSLVRRIRFPILEVSHQLNTRLREAKFVIWWVERDKKFAPGIFCENMATAVAALLATSVASPEGLGACERCGAWFSRKKRIQRYCSLRCGNAARKVRQRASDERG
jgi:hypothetical protein